jgi:hypothetical protein
MRKLSVGVCLLAMLCGAPYLFAGNYSMGYTPPGGVTINQGGGPSYTSSPALFSYQGFNSSDYQSLYYGVNYVTNVAQSDVLNPGNMAFQGYNSTTGILAWGSTQPWTFQNTLSLATVSTNTQLIVQIQNYTGTAGFLGSGFLNGETTTKSALGITNSGNANDPLFQVVSGGSFQITFQFQTWDGTPGNIANGQDLLDFYTANNGGNPTTVFNTSVDFEFWWSIPKTTAKIVQVGTCKTNLPNYATIQTAVSAVPSGATIRVCPGTYSEQVTINAPLTLVGIPNGTNQAVILNVPGVFEQNGTGPVSSYPIFAQILVQDAGPVNISGLTIDGSNSGCPGGAAAGVVYLSASNPSSGKLSSSVIRNTASGCGSQGAAVYGENGSGFASTVTVQGNSIHSINGGGIIFGPNLSGTISSNTIVQAGGGLMFQEAGPNIKATSNTITLTQNAISLNSATGVVAQANQLVNTSNKAISLQDNTGGTNTVTRNTINEANCGISTSGAATSDVYFPNTVVNAVASTCQ